MAVTRRIRRRGEHEISRKPLRAGMPGESGVPVVTTLVCLFSPHTRLRVHWPPGIPHALNFSGRTLHPQLGPPAPRECEVISEMRAGMRDAFPGCCATRRSSRRGALLIRGPCHHNESVGPGSAEQRKSAAPRPGHGTHCSTDWNTRVVGSAKHSVQRLSVPRMLRSAPLFAAWCAADPGPIAQGGWVPALRSSARALHRVRDTRPPSARYCFLRLAAAASTTLSTSSRQRKISIASTG